MGRSTVNTTVYVVVLGTCVVVLLVDDEVLATTLSIAIKDQRIVKAF